MPDEEMPDEKWPPEPNGGNPFGEREPQTLGQVIEQLKANGLLVPDVELHVGGDGGGKSTITFTDEPMLSEMLGREPDEFYPLGRKVLCDDCSTDFTDSDQSGGILFGSNAIGPCCVERAEASIRGFGEEDHIRGRCPAGQSFADWVRGFRGPDAGISIYRGQQ